MSEDSGKNEIYAKTVRKEADKTMEENYKILNNLRRKRDKLLERLLTDKINIQKKMIMPSEEKKQNDIPIDGDFVSGSRVFMK